MSNYTIEEIEEWTKIIVGEKQAEGSILDVISDTLNMVEWLSQFEDNTSQSILNDGSIQIESAYDAFKDAQVRLKFVLSPYGEHLETKAEVIRKEESKPIEPLRIYFANCLFNEATQDFNARVVAGIRDMYGEKVEVYLPQENDSINDKTAYADSKMIANADYDKLDESDLLVAVLDTNDFGVGLEIGIAYEKGLPIIGLYTDVRQLGTDNPKKINALVNEVAENSFSYFNLMGIGLIKNNGEIVQSSKQLINAIEDYLK